MSPRLFAQVASVEARKLMSYRGDFWVSAAATFLVELAVAYFLWLAVFAESGRQSIGGFSFGGMVLYYILVILLAKVVRGNERQLSMGQDIYEGSLTRYLLYPAPYFGMKYAEHLGGLVPAAVQLVLFGGASAVLFGPSAVASLSAAGALAALPALAAANLLYFLMLYTIQGVAFWADNVWTLNVMLRFVTSMLGGLLLPLTVFPAWARQVLELSPFPYLFYFPVMTLLGRLDPAEWARGLTVALLWCAVLALTARTVWRRGALTYTGVGI